jgi:trimethylamine---corrinoid protein Co-methyltransferase
MMDTNYSAHQTPQFRVLSDRQIEKVYHATLECLERTGVQVRNAEARDLLAAAGADVDGQRVYIPPHIIQDGVAANPRTFTIWGRPFGRTSASSVEPLRTQDEERRMQIAPDRVYFGPGPTCTYFVDPETGEHRKSRRGDPGLTALVSDALDNIDYVMGLALIDDVTPELSPVYEFAEMIANTAKPVLPWAYSAENVADIYQIALAVAGSEEALRRRPFLALFATFQAPLQHTDEDLANSLWAVEHGLPLVYLGGGSAGSTSPITGAGTLVISLAGMLSGLAIMQLKKRGAPVCVGSAPQPTDLRTARPSYGGPEMSLYSAALSDICRYLELPFMGTAGASESKVVDPQAAIESALQVLLSGLSGAALVHDVGFLDCADIGSLEMLVMNDELIAMARRVMCGLEISDDTLMLDLIDEVGPGGHFLAERETARRCRQEIWVPKLMDRDPWESWEAAGAETMNDRIAARLNTILATHQPPPLPDGVAEEIEAILQAAEARYH